jgi:MSHA biogenesis protein MshP
MSLNRSEQMTSVNRINKQQGSSLVVAIFILVVFAILALGITKTISSSTEQNVNEILGTRAMLAAETGNEIVLQQIFPLNGAAANCLASQQFYFAASGLESCNVQMSCQSTTVGGVNYYQVQSTGVCKAGLKGSNSTNDTNDVICLANEVCVSRTIEVEAKDVN